MLRKQVRLWSLGVQINIEHDPAALNCPSDTRLDCIEIFPVGGFIYITEDVFEEMPQLALKIVRLFCAKIDSIRSFTGSKTPWQEIQEVNLHWRLCVRPELMEYLFQRCEEQEKALEAGDANVLALAELYTILSDGKLIEQDTPVRSCESKCDSYPIMSERRTIVEGQPLDYFGALARNQEEATTRMVEYYGCVHVDMRRDYRHFYVVHTDPRAPCATRWKSKNHVLSDVITPEQCILELSKDGLNPESNSVFDFYERYLLGSSKEPTDDSNSKTLTSTQPGGRKGSLTLGELASKG
jgi:chromo domain-containing protein 1